MTVYKHANAQKEYAIIKLHRRLGDCEVTGEVFESPVSLLKKNKFSVFSNKKTIATNKNKKNGGWGVK